MLLSIHHTNCNINLKKLVPCGTDSRLLLSGFQAVVTLTLDQVIQHPLVHQLSSSIYIPNIAVIGKTSLWMVGLGRFGFFKFGLIRFGFQSQVLGFGFFLVLVFAHQHNARVSQCVKTLRRSR